MRRFALLLVLLSTSLVPRPAQAFWSIEWGLYPFGGVTPFTVIQVVATLTKPSPDQTIFFIEGVGVADDPNTYSLGGWSGGQPGIPSGYDFHFGNGGDTTLGPWNGQIAGPLAPGESKTFIFGEYIPTLEVLPGTYSTFNQLQFFAATTERPMVGQASFFGSFQVVDAVQAPEPGSAALLLLGLGALGAVGVGKRNVPQR